MEVTSILLQEHIKSCLSAYALCNMFRSSENKSYAEGALRWFTHLESSLQGAKAQLIREIERAK